MPALAVQVGGDPQLPLVHRMLEVVKDRGASFDIRSSRMCAMGLAEDDRLPGHGSIASDHGWLAVVVGSIDNPQDFQSSEGSAADLVLRLVRERGPRSIGDLRGAFAWVVTDGMNAWAARDHLGLETIFYRQVGQGFFLASETLQLLEVAERAPEPDLEFLEAFLFAEPREESRCAYAGISRLPKRSLLVWSPEAIRMTRYWTPEDRLEQAPLPGPEISERFDHLMAQAVKRAMPRPTAVLLSGGIDSPAVAAYAAPVHRERFGSPLGAVTATYPSHATVDELSYVRVLAEAFGLDLHTFEAAPLRLDRLADWVVEFGGPWAYWHPGQMEESYLLAAGHGYRNILTGNYAEDVFERRVGLLAHLLWAGHWKEAARFLADRHATGLGWRKNAKELITALVPRAAVAARRRRQPRFTVPAWIDQDRFGKAEAARATSPRMAWRRAQLSMLQGAGVSGEADSMLQARLGVRVRHPW
ncbi:MAG TPA: asparagine synthase-related protein, partial [Acidimicrobiia bacterium]